MSKILGIVLLNMIMQINMFVETPIRVGLVRQVNRVWSTGEYLWTNQRPVCAVQDCISMSWGYFFVSQSYWITLKSLSIFKLPSSLLLPSPPPPHFLEWLEYRRRNDSSTWIRTKDQLVLVFLTHNTKQVILSISCVSFKVFQVYT